MRVDRTALFAIFCRCLNKLIEDTDNGTLVWLVLDYNAYHTHTQLSLYVEYGPSRRTVIFWELYWLRLDKRLRSTDVQVVFPPADQASITTLVEILIGKIEKSVRTMAADARRPLNAIATADNTVRFAEAIRSLAEHLLPEKTDSVTHPL